MKGFDEFIKLFGEVTVLQVAEFVLAIVFMIVIYKKVKKFFSIKTKEEIERASAEKERDAKIKEALDAVHKYPQYRQQSIAIQNNLQAQILELKEMHTETTDRLAKMEEDTRRRECNKLRDRLLQNYRYYINKETNPSHSWTEMESDAFWRLFEEYEANGGDGYMHTDVQPAMQSLNVIKK